MTFPARRIGSPPEKVRALQSGTALDDATLVMRARDGDRWAEEALYNRYVDYITGMVIRLLGRRAEAEDVVQDTFTIGFDRLATLEQPEAVRAWFARIAVRQISRRTRRLKLLAALGLHGPVRVPLESLATQDADAETLADLAEVGRILARQPTNDRVAWMLRYVEGEPLDEVARLCGCSLATAKRRIAAAALHLQHHFAIPEDE
jgi:RNA polymerase sigma-70 factor, ECF subfamily